MVRIPFRVDPATATAILEKEASWKQEIGNFASLIEQLARAPLGSATAAGIFQLLGEVINWARCQLKAGCPIRAEVSPSVKVGAGDTSTTPSSSTNYGLVESSEVIVQDQPTHLKLSATVDHALHRLSMGFWGLGSELQTKGCFTSPLDLAMKSLLTLESPGRYLSPQGKDRVVKLATEIIRASAPKNILSQMVPKEQLGFHDRVNPLNPIGSPDQKAAKGNRDLTQKLSKPQVRRSALHG